LSEENWQRLSKTVSAVLNRTALFFYLLLDLLDDDGAMRDEGREGADGGQLRRQYSADHAQGEGKLDSRRRPDRFGETCQVAWPI
jgi:hypothetical protein